MEVSTSSPPNIAVFPSEVAYLKNLLDGLVEQYRALVELSNLSETGQKAIEGFNSQPLIEKLTEYPPKDVNLENLVTYPPKLEPVPVKPLFFDVAWNYIQYPGRELSEKVVESNVTATPASAGAAAEQTSQQKRGWFGFGRS
jgi:signal recognition particle subunit SRP68